MSTSSRQVRIEELFLAASDLDTAAREPFLAKQCEGDHDLRKEVESLLSNVVEDDFLDSSESPGKQLLTKIGLDIAAIDEPVLPSGTRINSYTIRSVIGSGGMGVVYVGEQEMPRRTVAIKLVRGGSRSDRIIRRFEFEAEMLGRLAHPGIAQIYEAGRCQTEHGQRPFIAMEFVRGLHLTQHSARNNLPVRARMELIAKVCDAIQHAHRCGIIHRDLKPANILVAEDGQPKILDFGVARALDADHRVTTVQTGIGQIIGTLPYMSPEQVMGDPATIDTRTDVYAVGVLLYELLTGRLPHDLRSRPLPEAARIIRDEAPARLSTIDRTLRGDIETIVAKALEKDRARRYQSAAELADDIRRFLAGEPILAKHDSAFYVLRKQLRRYRGAVAVGAAFVVALVVFSAYSSLQRTKAVDALLLEEFARRTAVEQRTIAVQERERADEKAEELRRNLYASAIAFAQASYSNADLERMKRVLAGCPEDLRGWEWHYLKRLSDASRTSFSVGHLGGGSWAVAPNGASVAAWLSDGGSIAVHDSASGRMLFCHESPGIARAAAFSEDAGVLAVCYSGPSRIEWLLGDTGQTLFTTPAETGELFPVAFGAGGTRLLCMAVSAERLDGWAILDADTGAVVSRISAPGIAHGTLSLDGSRVACSSGGTDITVWDAMTGEQINRWRAHERPVMQLVITPDNQNVISSSADTTIKAWDIASGSAWNTVHAHDNKVWAISLSSDGRHVASAGTDLFVHVSDLFTGKVERSYVGHENTVVRVQFTPGGDQIISAARDGTCRRWGGEETGLQRTRLAPGIGNAALAPDGGTLFVGDMAGRLNCWTSTAAGGPPSWSRKMVAGMLDILTVSPDSKMLGLGHSGDASIDVIDTSTMQKIATIAGLQPRVVSASFTPDSSRIALASTTGEVVIADARSGTVQYRFTPHARGTCRLAWSPDGKHLATAGWVDLSLRVWNMHEALAGGSAASAPMAGVYTGATNYAWTVSYTGDGKSLISANEDGNVYVWDVERGGIPRVIQGHKGPVYSANLTRDGSRMVTGGWDNNVRVWDFKTGQEFLVLRGNLYSVLMTMFSADEKTIISAGNDGELRWWQTEEAARSGLFE